MMCLKYNKSSFRRPISATDADVGVNGLVRYSISRTYPRGLDSHFAVDGVTGVLSVVAPLVNSSSSQVAVSVRATDSGTRPLYSDVNVTISLLTPGSTCTCEETGKWPDKAGKSRGLGTWHVILVMFFNSVCNGS
ncbi:cadherin EGF LAG seven-pass G-type receptor 3-like [Haliotis rufescens]|uniref:cadherin EGF LAG seven-pass G-type receptor 3-like n=1 Tax=Haliotis rufescens TaxID=6454 RepID=UPI00201F4668|nr:cadherin EGF LAG seven-pass G-type receptor 3-like [Haliotis rufescens]